jgi:putative (di)nucleoside polyphosphate hydrolase
LIGKPYRPNVGAVLRRADGKVLMAERIAHPGSWQLPQGGVDPGETKTEALWREIGEELGFDAPQSLCRIVATAPPVRYDFPVGSNSRISEHFAGQEQTLYLLDYSGTDAHFDLLADEHPEFSAIQWVTPAEAIALIWEVKRPVLETSFRALALI